MKKKKSKALKRAYPKSNRMIDYHNKEVSKLRRMEKLLGLRPLIFEASDLTQPKPL